MSGSVYDALGAAYDLFERDTDYGAIEDGVLSLAERFGDGGIRSVLDLGCGTGKLSGMLAARGYDVTGLDSSVEMLAAASAKEECRGVFFITGDVRRFELPGSVDAVTATQDVISHLTDTRSLRACFSRVSDALRPGGVFVFDVNTPHRIKNVYGDNVFVFEEDGVMCVWQNEFRARDCTAAFYVTVFREEGGAWERSDGFARERGWSKRTLFSALSGSGLEPVFCGSAWDLGDVRSDTERAAIAAVKR